MIVFKVICILWLAIPNFQPEIKNSHLQDDKVLICDTINSECNGCPLYYEEGQSNSSLSGTITICLLLGLVSFYLFSVYKKKIIIVAGSIMVIALVTTSFINKNAKEPESTISITDTINNTDEFIDVSDDEFLPVEDDFSESGDEFSKADDEFTEVSDEFSESLDEFSEPLEGKFSEELTKKNETSPATYNQLVIDLLILLVLYIVIGLFIKNKTFRKLRPLFLLAMLVWLGFIHGGCPCMISSMQNFFLMTFGNKITWISTLWFLGLIPLTYVFGKIWCGWLCHLGAFQEFLFGATHLNFLRKEKHQKILKSIQIGVFIILIVQLFITRNNIFIHYDPFKVAFNVFSSNTLGYVLLGILLISSVIIYRPFCRSFCPVGLILGWVAFIPGAKKISIQQSCTSCNKCVKICKSAAITNTDKSAVINKSDCIFCGECLDNCNKKSIQI